jgi:hypothetical protein
LIKGRYYLGMDMGGVGKTYRDRKTGLMRLYGKEVPLDRRQLIGYVRDFSAISEQDYQAFDPPGKLRAFPEDLGHPDLEYSGICEDGWIGEAAYFYLGQQGSTDRFVLRGHIPRLRDSRDWSTELCILLDGEEIKRQTLRVGDVEVVAKVPPGKGRRRIDLRFSGTRPLPAPDGRPMAARITELGFESSAAGR